MTAPELELRPDPKHLALLASNVRGWDYEEIYSAILAAGHAGWTFEQVFREVARLIVIADSGPADLRAKAARPTLALPTGPEVNARGRQLARELYEKTKSAQGRQDPEDNHLGETA